MFELGINRRCRAATARSSVGRGKWRNASIRASCAWIRWCGAKGWRNGQPLRDFTQELALHQAPAEIFYTPGRGRQHRSLGDRIHCDLPENRTFLSPFSGPVSASA